MTIQDAIKKLSQRQSLTFEEAQNAMQTIMDGQATQAQIGAYLMALRLKGETVDEIAASAQVMRQFANDPLVSAKNVVDTCGTGGDARNTFNISTTVAFVVAAAGVPVAKHGNRSVSSKSGSADVLRELGVNLDLTPVQAGQCVDEVGIGFLFAPAFHPAMKHAIGPRREMGVRTIFNILGPLTNPAGAKRQLMGVFAGELTEPLAHVLHELGSEAVFVVHGADGLDELSTTGPNIVSELRAGEVHNYTLDPAELGLHSATLDDLRGGEPAENAEITRAVLAGRGTDAQQEITALNAAAALAAGGVVPDVAEGLKQAQEIIRSGAGLEKLEALVSYSKRLGT
ncbi:MAG: anthranilate phosphoribosyltransferase [Anaerolineales bacterium]